MNHPNFSNSDAKNIASKHFNQTVVKIKPLVSYVDYNFLIETEKQQKFVLKIHNSADEYSSLKSQNDILDFLEKEAEIAHLFPKLILSVQNEKIIQIEHKGTKHYVRLLTFLEGKCLGDVEINKKNLAEVGGLIGQFNRSLAKLNLPALKLVDHNWDLRRVLEQAAYLPFIADAENRRLVNYFLLQYKEIVVPRLPTLRKGALHGDLNEHNIVVQNEHISGFIDFGDVYFGPIINDPAIALAYLLMYTEEPLKLLHAFIEAYHREFPLEKKELEILYYLVAARLCQSVLHGANAIRLDPENTYISISKMPAFNFLHRLLSINPLQFKQVALQAAGYEFNFPKNYEKELAARYKHLSPALSLSYSDPLKIGRGALQYLYDEQGRSYLDCVNNICHVGHCHPHVVAAAQRQIARLNTNTRYLYDSLNAYAAEICATLPKELDTVFFVNSGSEATELAIRIARMHTKAEDIMVVDGAYHGNSSNCIAISPYKFEGNGGFEQKSWVHKVPVADGYRGIHRATQGEALGAAPEPRLGECYAQYVGECLSKVKENKRKIAAFFCESLLGCGGQIVLPTGYLKAVYRQVRAAGGLCVADEVQVGFGRVGKAFWGFETQGVVPDIVVLGKPIGNGHPMAAVVTTKAIADSFNNGMEYFSSFGGNPVSCATGRAVLQVIQSEGLQQHALDVGDFLLNELNARKSKYPLIGDVRGMGLFLGIELVRDHQTLEPADREASFIVNQLRKQGVLLSTDGPLHNVIKLKPPMVFGMRDAKRLLKELDAVFPKLG